MNIIDGKYVAENLLGKLLDKHNKLKKIHGRPARLVVILVGSNESSKMYVRNKERVCNKLGIDSSTIVLDENVTKEKLIEVIEKENANPFTDGILLQLPLPKHLNQIEITSHIDFRKDVDGFSPINIGKLILNQKGIRPCTALGVIKLLKEYKVKIEGADVVIIGRSNIVGKPLANMLTNMSATVQVCHSKTVDIDSKIEKADILITAAGYPKLINSHHKLKKNVCIIDVGINRVNSKLCGDVAIDEIDQKKVSLITPVPGGVGPMTVACLIENLLNIYENKY